MIRILLSLLFLSLLTFSATAQLNNEIELLSTEEIWNEGSILLSDNREVKGPIKFDFRTGIVAYHDGEESHAYGPRSVIGFEFYDEAIKKQRIFYSMEYESDDKSDPSGLFFFEIIRDYGSFAIVSRVTQIKRVEKKQYGVGVNGLAIGVGPTEEFQQIESILIMDNKGTMKLYFKTILKEDGLVNVSTGEDVKQKGKMVDFDLLSEYITVPEWNALLKYADSNKLEFKRKEDFLQILDYYDSIRE